MADRMTTTPVTNDVSVEGEEALSFTYTNWRGETAVRRIRAKGATFHFGSTEWHPEPQWLLSAIDLDKMEGRDFALKDIVFAARPAITAGTDAGAEEPSSTVSARVVAVLDFPASDPGDALRQIAIDLLSSLGIVQSLSPEYDLRETERALRRAIASTNTPETAEAVPVAAQPNEAVREALRRQIADQLEQEADLIPCDEDASVFRSAAQLVRANFSYADADAFASVPAPAGDDALRRFAESFKFTVTDSFYNDAYLTINEPDSASFRIGNGSQFSKFIAALEARRRAALSQPKEPRT